MIKYSVVVPVYNTHKELQTIVEWFDLICAQRGDVELIIVDDGSKERLKPFTSERISYIYKTNGGVSSARNVGIENATGEYILFLDSDDAFSVNIFSTLDAKINCEQDIVFSSFSRVREDETEAVVNVSKEYKQEDFIKAYCIKDIKVHICSSIFKRAFLQHNRLRFNESISFSEDVLFIINAMFVAEKIKVLSDILFFYNLRNGSAINSKLGKKSLSHFVAAKEIKKHTNSANERYLNYFMATWFTNLLIMLAKNKTSEQALLTAFIDFKKSLLSPSVTRFNIIGGAVLGTRVLSLLPDKLWMFVLKRWMLK